MLGKILAANLGKQVGDAIEIYENESFRIVGVYDGGNIFDNGAMIVPLVELQRMLDQSGQVTAFNVRVDRAAWRSIKSSWTRSTGWVRALGHGDRELRRDR